MSSKPHFPTPNYKLSSDGDVYPPAEDTFLLLDALEKDIHSIAVIAPEVAVEIGPGSGVVTSFLYQVFPNPCLTFAIDVNPYACKCTQRTANLNEVSEFVDVIQGDLASTIWSRLREKVDVLLFNPPYVPTDEPAKARGELCYAGGKAGRCVLDRLMPKVPKLLSHKGAFYVVALKQNNVPEMLSQYSDVLKGSVVLERQCGIEYLYVLKFQRVV